MIRFFPLALVASLAACSPAPANVQGEATVARVESVRLTARDGVAVFGEYRAAVRPKALILLFHQAGSSHHEYAGIAPRLVDAGYSTLAIDQRAGGAMFGRNATAAGVRGQPDYLAARADVQAALDWAGNKGVPVVLWGSSYSASLVFMIAADNPGRVAAVMAFSPGEYFGRTASVRDAAARVRVPVYLTSASDSGEEAAARAIADAVPGGGAMRYVPVAGGVHGSSTLIPARNPGGAAANWDAALAFLRSVIG